MTPDDDLSQKVLHLFAVEAKEVIQTINQSCLALEQLPGAARRSDLITTILRQAHNLKGTARAVGLENVFLLTHRLETLFETLKENGAEPETAVFDLIYQTLDGIGPLIAGASAQDVGLDRLLNRLETAVAHSNPPQTPPTQAPTAVDARLPDTVSPPPQETIRVAVSRLDAILNLVNELQAAHLGLEQNLRQMRHLFDNLQHTAPPTKQFNDLYRRSETDHRHLNQLLAQLQDNVRQARMLPLAIVFDALPRIARALAQELGKEVALHLEGGDIELDRAVLERIKSPLQHLLHNSIDHGLEIAEKRRAAGKTEMGQVTITAVQRGSGILIEISDDGAGIDLGQVKEQAVRRHLLTADEAKHLNEQEIIWLLFRPGFSLANEVTAVSGRGIGLDIVRQVVESLHGMLSVENRPGQGVRLSLSLPVSIATSSCLLVRADSQTFALPTRQVVHLTRVCTEQIRKQNGRLHLIRPKTEPIPAISLAHALTGNGHLADDKTARTCQTAVLLGPPEQPTALLVDELQEVGEIVIKKLPPPLTHMPCVSGASITPTGAVILVLSVTDLIRAARHRE